MNEKDVAKILIERLLDSGFTVHRYDSYSTNSIYLKLDFGVACGIRIADHLGKKKYSYRFNVIKNYKGEKVVFKDDLISFFYNFNELEEVLDAIKKEKQKKIDKYGVNNYQMYMKIDAKDDLYKRFIEMKGDNRV